MPKQTPKLNPEWVKQTRDYFLKFLTVTKFPHPVRNGTRGSEFDYPEWLIMLIAVLAVKAKAKTYLAIHRLALQYWNILSEGQHLKPISERQLRDRLKKNQVPARKNSSVCFSNIFSKLPQLRQSVQTK